MNAYVYAPKDDPKHRAEWRVPVRRRRARDGSRELAAHARDARRAVRLRDLARPRHRPTSRRDDRAALLAKLAPLLDAGVDWFLLARSTTSRCSPGSRRARPTLATWLLDALRAGDAGRALTLVPDRVRRDAAVAVPRASSARACPPTST